MPVAVRPASPVWTAGAPPAGVRRAMAAEGLLVEVLPSVWLPADLVREPAARAAALVAHVTGACALPGSVRWCLPPGAVVALAAAAWVHGCPAPPRRVDLLVPRGTGPGPAGGAVRLRRVAEPARGARTVGDLVVTGPERTVEDLTGSADPQDRAALAWARGTQVDAVGQAPACSSRRPVAR
ncbi:hypothetical protein WDZ17_04895 [Pseudokineococcus basanitobsidens]|uniref:Uncharacterized protein n=1 Tax=Pseudokineococcus basanitobsidens TaxID=1926649 RepID=A0ABU8RI29_9ACTN